MTLCRRAIALFIMLPVATLVAGVLTMGARAHERTVPSAAGGACTQHTLKFGVSDDPAEVGRQRVFEAALTAVTAPGFYAHPTPATATLHAASHSSIVVFYRPDLPAGQLRPLRALAEAGQATKAPVIVAPRRQAAALTTLGLGEQLTCTAADAAQTARVRAFAATVYPSLKAR
jgi:Protein of unknown function (DUF3105)